MIPGSRPKNVLDTSGLCSLWWPTIILRQLCLFCNTQLSSEWEKTQTQMVFITLCWKTYHCQSHFPLLSCGTPWIPGSSHDWLGVCINIRIKIYLSLPRIGFGYFTPIEWKTYFTFSQQSTLYTSYSMAPLETPTPSPQEQDLPGTLLNFPLPAPSINDYSIHL